MATEIAIFPLLEGQRPEDPDSNAWKVLSNCFKTLIGLKGVQSAYWGTEVEHPEMFRIFVHWTSLDAHYDFMKTDIYAPFLGQFGEIADISKGQLFHAHLDPHPSTAALASHTSPATEILTLYFPLDYSESDKKKFDQNWKELTAILAKNADVVTGSAGGWIVEDITIPGTDEKASAYAGFIGWQSVQAHLDFRNTQFFKDNIHLLKDAKGLKHVQAVHYSGTPV